MFVYKKIFFLCKRNYSGIFLKMGVTTGFFLRRAVDSMASVDMRTLYVENLSVGVLILIVLFDILDIEKNIIEGLEKMTWFHVVRLYQITFRLMLDYFLPYLF